MVIEVEVMFDLGLGALIDLLRQRGDGALADMVQFGVEGFDRWDGHRCRICDQLAGGDASHRCWASDATTEAETHNEKER